MSSIVLKEQASTPGTPASGKWRVWIDSSGVLHATEDDGTDWEYHAVRTGTWSPAITGSGSDPTVTYTAQNGFYRRISDMVFVRGRIVINTYSGGSGNALISLPVAVTSGNNAYAGNFYTSGVDLATSMVNGAFRPTSGTSTAQLIETIDNAAVSAVQCSALAASDTIIFQGWYMS